MAHAILVGYKGGESNLGSLPPNYWYHCSSHDIGGQQNASRKADQLTLILTLDTLGMDSH